MRNLGSLLRSGSAFAHIAYCHYYKCFCGKSQYEMQEFKPIRVVIRIGFLLLFWTAGNRSVNFHDSITPSLVVLANYDSQKQALWWGRGWYTLLQSRNLLKNHTLHGFSKRESSRVRRSLAFLVTILYQIGRGSVKYVFTK